MNKILIINGITTVSESFFSKTAKFKPTLLKSSVGMLNQFNTAKKANLLNTKADTSFANTLNNTISQTEVSKFKEKLTNTNHYHEVKTGETLTHIALRTMKKEGLNIGSRSIMQTALKLAKFNGIKNPNLIIPGQKIDLSIIKSNNLALENINNSFDAKPDLSLKTDSSTSTSFEAQQGQDKTTTSQPFQPTLKNIKAIEIESTQNKQQNIVLNKTLNRAIDLGYITDSEAIQAKEKIFSMAGRFKFSPDDFARVALMESDGFNPKASNGNCFGIIQFCDGQGRGAASVGLSHDPKKILELNVPDQLDLVSQYFEDTDLNKFKPASLDQLYLTILSPASRDVFNVNEPLLIPGSQARALHVGGLKNAPITKASIVKGLINHAKNTLSNHFFSKIEDKSNGSVALNSNYKLGNK